MPSGLPRSKLLTLSLMLSLLIYSPEGASLTCAHIVRNPRRCGGKGNEQWAVGVGSWAVSGEP